MGGVGGCGEGELVAGGEDGYAGGVDLEEMGVLGGH